MITPTMIALGVGLGVLIALAASYKLLLRLLGGVIVERDAIAIVTKKFVLFGKNKQLPEGSIIALNGEAGIQADTLPPGLHFGYWPWQYRIDMQKFIQIPQGRIGIVEAKDGTPLSDGRVLAKEVNSEAFQNARAFLQNGGERGPQLNILPPGLYRVNTALFAIELANVTEIPDNQVGVVTTLEGKALDTSKDIAGKTVDGHNAFQNGQSFLNAGGYKGLQEQVLLAGRYFINPRFAQVELQPMTTVPIANVGVVISYIGEAGKDISGEAFKHGNLVAKGQKGVWAEPLDPGKYPVNPYTHKIELVPTANVVLNWATGKTEAHNLDKNLSTITVRSSDGFTFNLDVSQIIHIPRNDAPKVIARFGNMANLVTQVLEPTIGNYFRNAAQKSDVIDFLKNRSTRQDEAKQAISNALTEYNVGAVDTLIGDITPPQDLMKTLTDRKLAEQQKVTFETQKLAEDTRKELAQSKAMADTQPNVVNAERSVSIAEFNAQAAVKTAEGEAKAKVIAAEAEANRTATVGKAEAERTLAIGSAEADVIKMKINSMEAGNYAGVQIAEALSKSGQRLVPEITVGNNGNGSDGGSLVGALLAMMVKRELRNTDNPTTTLTPKDAH